MEPLREFQKIPGVGKKLAPLFLELGYHSVEDLKGESAEDMYQRVISIQGRHIDRCVLYVFRAAVYFASNTARDPRLEKWWNWSDKNMKAKKDRS